MKKGYFLLTACILCWIFTACADSSIGSDEKETSKTVNISKSGGGSAVNKIEFETLNESDIPETLKSKISKMQNQKGYIFEEQDNYYYFAIMSGEKPTGGYDIKVLSVDDNEGRTNILVKERTPGKGDIVTQVLTYPYVVIKIKAAVKSNFNIKSTKGEIFNRLN